MPDLDPSESRGNSITAREILDKASNQIKAGLSQDPEVQAELMYTMARTYQNLGLFSLAYELSGKALEVRRQRLGPESPKTLESSIQLGSILDREGHEAEAERVIREALDVSRRVLGAEDPRTLQAMDRLAPDPHARPQGDGKNPRRAWLRPHWPGGRAPRPSRLRDEDHLQ